MPFSPASLTALSVLFSKGTASTAVYNMCSSTFEDVLSSSVIATTATRVPLVHISKATQNRLNSPRQKLPTTQLEYRYGIADRIWAARCCRPELCEQWSCIFRSTRDRGLGCSKSNAIFGIRCSIWAVWRPLGLILSRWLSDRPCVQEYHWARMARKSYETP
jgi:hypothetical protein